MSWPEYWLSASVLTMTSAPSLSAASRPAWKPAARPLLFVRRTMWSTPFARATSMVRSVEPSSMISHSTDVEARDLAREVGQRCRERRLLVEAGDLDDELHARAGRRGDGACREVDAVHSLAPSIPHGERDDHPAGPGPGPCCRPPQPASGRGRCWRSPCSRWARWSGSSSTRPIPNYDSYYSLLWGRELLHGIKPSFDGYRTPTEHPLAVAFGARALDRSATPPTGSWSAPRWRRSSCSPPGSTAWRAASFGTLVGLAAAALLCTRFDFPFLAARGYIDIPTWPSSCGPPRSRPSARAAAPSCSCCWPARG